MLLYVELFPGGVFSVQSRGPKRGRSTPAGGQTKVFSTVFGTFGFLVLMFPLIKPRVW